MRGHNAPGDGYPQHAGSSRRSQRSETLIRNDPKHCLTALFDARRPLPRGSAEDALLAWIITLPDGLDPARAASELGAVAPFAGPRRDEKDAETGRLCALLAEIARYPADRLGPPAARRRRPSLHA